ncbi:baseplate J/gp47 family protein [Gluconobacter frateurii]|uniref:Phage Mu protein n=1 Tax=Gluconobacter frateurii NRIC 0228 TaxID=1307946 RepID=A0ABQ0QD97_9PROT|nr:baseplate J/gp47 family protein [Gluconobacter frateurii]GBR14164.1 phage Mu protein [Gluconobacter frateurii NRIC 0228]GLP92021.1 hypothetical protein GCM10007868_30960 [Gluconobacter frateurii]
MAFLSPTYQDILQTNINEVTYTLTNGQVPLANSVIRTVMQANSKVQWLQYAFLQKVALQATPATSTGIYLDYWGSLKGITRKASSTATSQVTFTGTSGVSIPASSVLIAQNGETYTTDNLVLVGSSVGITAVSAGTEGNQLSNITLTLQTPIAGVDSTIVLTNAITNGSDVETDDLYRVRVLQAYSTQATGDSRQEHINWALAVPSVTAAWVPSAPLVGTQCVIYVMLDRTNSFLGYPQGTDGTATAETRYTTATGDQLSVANAMYDEKPYTEIQIITAPVRNDIGFEISGLASASAAVQASVKTAIQTLFHAQGTPLGTDITIAAISEAISQTVGGTDFTITSPTTDIKLNIGDLPEVGTVTFS